MLNAGYASPADPRQVPAGFWTYNKRELDTYQPIDNPSK